MVEAAFPNLLHF